MKTKIIIIFILFFFKEASAIENKILFKVNNKIITSIDIQDEMNYLNSINTSFKDLDKIKMIEISKNSLIRSRIKEIFLEKLFKKIELNESDFERILFSNYSNTGIVEISELQKYLQEFNIDIKNLKKKLAIDNFWNQIIYDKYFKAIKIDIEKIKKNISKKSVQKEYQLSEIVFNLNLDENFKVKLDNISQSIEEKGFENSALIFSESDTSGVGGKLGWINENSINQKILSEILVTKEGDYTKPMKIPSGFLILKINEIREVEKNINLEDELKKIIRIKTNEQLNQYSNLFYNKIKKDIIINEF